MLHENHQKFTTPVLPLPCNSCIVMKSLFTLVLCVYYDGFYEGRQRCDNHKISKRNQTLWSKAFSLGVPYKAVVAKWTKTVNKENWQHRERIKAAWEELDQCIIDTAVRQWCTRLHACVKAKGDHSEHKLLWLNDEMLDKLFNRIILTIGFYYISEFLIRCVVSHIAHILICLLLKFHKILLFTMKVIHKKLRVSANYGYCAHYIQRQREFLHKLVATSQYRSPLTVPKTTMCLSNLKVSCQPVLLQ